MGNMPPSVERGGRVPDFETVNTKGDATVPRGRVIWRPTAEDIDSSTITAFMRWLAHHRSLVFASYADLLEWSVTDREQFWGALWDYFQIEASTPYEAVFRGDSFQDISWFPGAHLNFAQHVLRHETRLAERAALFFHSEDGSSSTWTWSDLGRAVRTFATALRNMGIKPGDRVVGYIPNIAEASIALLAVTAIGAVWSSCSPEFGPLSAIDRFGQLEPKVLLAVPHYRYAGKVHDRREALRDILDAMPSVEHVVLVSDDTDWLAMPDRTVSSWRSRMETAAPGQADFHFEAVPADHPLWIVFTSGTSGQPKAIVHSHIGALLGLMKDLGFHVEVTEQSVLFFYCTTSWIVWNLVLGGLSLGATVVQYDGSPFFPDIGRLWSIAEQRSATVLGTSPSFVGRMIDKTYVPAERHDLSSLECIILAGAVVEDAVSEWLSQALPPRTRIVPQAGSTEICGGYAGGVRLMPIRAGEIAGRMLGMKVEALDPQSQPVRNQPAELIIRAPFPNAPRGLWGDPTGVRLAEAYLSDFPGEWRQGDMITIFPDGGCRVSGRSDATIKKNGVRMGSNELYRALADDPLVADAIAICPQAGEYKGQLMLFVQLSRGTAASDDLHDRIASRIAHSLSPRHVPDIIVDVPAIPYTPTGKRLEVPLRQLVEGAIAPSQFATSLQHDPDTGRWYIHFSAQPSLADTGDA